MDRFGAEALRPQVEFIFSFFIRHWKEPLAVCAADMAQAARRALETGSLEYWAYNLSGADVADLACDLADVGVELAGQVADAFLLAVGATDGVGAAVDLDGDGRHQRPSCSARVSRMASAARARARAAS